VPDLNCFVNVQLTTNVMNRNSIRFKKGIGLLNVFPPIIAEFFDRPLRVSERMFDPGSPGQGRAFAAGVPWADDVRVFLNESREVQQ
jgi:hypothetical protein